MQATGNTPPATLPSRGSYLMKDFDRCGKYFGINLRLPSNFPVNTIPSMRLLTVTSLRIFKRQGHSIRGARILGTFEFENVGTLLDSKSRYPHSRRLVGKLHRYLSLVHSLEGVGISSEKAEEFIAQTQSQTTKDKLRQVTEEAVERGAFGSPTFFVRTDDMKQPEMFFGSDRFPQMAQMFNLPWDGPFPTGSSKL